MEIFNAVDLIDTDNKASVQRMFDEGVTALMRLLVERKTILHVPVSQGKDSTVVELMALEAYRRLIAQGDIERSHPLVFTTVDTYAESIPMRFYVRYCHRRVVAYAKTCGINLTYDIVGPSLNDQYFVKYLGAQKLIPNATRRGDCSIILKVSPSERHLTNLFAQYRKEGSIYQDHQLVSCVGSRTEESQRRQANMERQGLTGITADDIIDNMTSDNVGSAEFYKLAPIQHWKTEQVFDLLRVAGHRPLSRPAKNAPQVPGFLENFGLLIEIYGNGSNEVCEISVGKQSQGAGCNGKARFGCSICTMVAKTDKSSTALTAYPRWKVLGAEDVLRVRDWLFRLSCDVDARAFHARSHDPIGFHRVALQPNTLRPQYLEEAVRFASQLSVDAINKAKAFADLVAQGREMEHAGYADIFNDVNIAPKTKAAYLEMYKECAQDPTCLNTLFSEKHAWLLSFRWSIDGIGAAPFRPLAIWQDTLAGKDRMPYPLLNSEYEAQGGTISMDTNLPEAVMMPIFKQEDAKQHALSHQPLLSYWSRPNDISDLFDADSNCSVTTRAKYLAPLSVTYIQEAKVTSHGGLTIRHKIGSMKLQGKSLTTHSTGLLHDSILETLQNNADLAVQDTDLSAEELAKQLNGVFTETLNVKHLRPVSLAAGFSESERAVVVPNRFTRRVTKMLGGKYLKGNTRLAFPTFRLDDKPTLAREEAISFFDTDFQTFTEKHITTTDRLLFDSESVLENIEIVEKHLSMAKAIGADKAARTMHDDWVTFQLKRGGTVNSYGGTHVAEWLLQQGIVSISKRYWGQLRAVLHRTHIFNDMGLFEFQSQRLAAVAEHPKAITMAQHRQDKIAVLSVIRKHRNAKRIVRKASNSRVNLTSLKALESNLGLFSDALSKQVITSLGARFSDALKVRFHTADVGSKQQADTSRFALSLNLEGVTTTKDLLKRLLTRSMLTTVRDNPGLLTQAANLVQDKLTGLVGVVNEQIQTWQNTAMLLENLLSQNDKITKEDYLAFIKATGLEIETPMYDFWNPKPSVRHHQLQIINLELRTALRQLKGYAEALNKLTTSAVTREVGKMTLEEKLALRAQRLVA
ncbi:MAG: hypothetical protein JXQ95_06910 [Alteromonas stellipolaris]|uniref:hypothetical protein n=1 Tax=Alteromonas stellipolaris TaxID=233316 RepID=UPI003B8CB144